MNSSSSINGPTSTQPSTYPNNSSQVDQSNNTSSSPPIQYQSSITSSNASNFNLTGSINLGGGLSYIDYLARVGKPLLEHRHQIAENSDHDFSSETIQKFIMSILRDIENSRAFRKQVIENGAGVTDLRDQQNAQINTLNNQTKIYNNGVNSENSAIHNLNDKIIQFNNGEITEAELQAEINDYNNYATNRNGGAITDVNGAINTYNQQVVANNQQIDVLNAQRVLLGLPPIAYQQPVTVVSNMGTVTVFGPLTPPLGTLPENRTKVPKVSTYTAPPTQDDLNNLVDAALAAAKNSAALLGDKISQIQNVAEYKRFKLQSKHPTKPNAYIDHFNDRSPAARGGSTFGLSFFLAQSAPNLLGTLSLSNFKNALSEFGQPLPRETQYTTNSMVNGFLNAAGASSLARFSELQTELNVNAPVGTPAGKLTLALAFSQQVSKINADPDIQRQIETVLKEDPAIASLPPEQQKEGIALILGGIQQTLSLTALLQVAIASNSPGLVAQVVAQAVPGVDDSLTTPPTIEQFNHLLEIGGIQEDLKGTLQQLAGKFGGNAKAGNRALENTLLQGAQFVSVSKGEGGVIPGTPLVGVDGTPLIRSDGTPLVVPENREEPLTRPPENQLQEKVNFTSSPSNPIVRRHLLEMSDVLGGFKSTVSVPPSIPENSQTPLPKVTIAGFAVKSEGEFFQELAQNLQKEGFNPVSASKLATELTLTLVNQTAVPNLLGRDLERDLDSVNVAVLNHPEGLLPPVTTRVSPVSTQGKERPVDKRVKSDEGIQTKPDEEIAEGIPTQLDLAVKAALQKDQVETVGQLRDEIVRQLVTRQVDFDQALVLANDAVQVVIQGNKVTERFPTNTIDKTALENALKTELEQRAISSDLAQQVIVETFKQSNALTSKEQFRETLANVITEQGAVNLTTATDVANATQISSREPTNEALSTSGLTRKLSPEELAHELQTSLIAQLTGQIGQEPALRLTGEIVLNVIGFEATKGEPRRNPSSVSNQIQSAVQLGIEISKNQKETERADAFRAFSSPHIDLFTITQAKLDPANSILMSGATGIMYDQGPSGGMFQTPGSSLKPSANSIQA